MDNPEIFIIERHGARFSIGHIGDKTWPDCLDFHKKFGGTLLPRGVIETHYLGSCFNERYPFIHDLSNNYIHCYTSDLNRTICTGLAMVDTMFPERPVSLLKGYRNINDDNLQLVISDIFHHSRMYPELTEWQRENKRLGLSVLLNNPDYINVAKKITSHYNYDTNSSIETLLNTKKLYTQYKINMYQNINNLVLSKHELSLLDKISSLHHKYRFSEFDGYVRDSKGMMVSSDIINLMKLFTVGCLEQKVTVLFGHDTTLFSLASIMGIDINMPYFNGYFLIERYDNEIKFSYHESIYDISMPKKWKKLDTYQDYNTLPQGSFTINEFYEILS